MCKEDTSALIPIHRNGTPIKTRRDDESLTITTMLVVRMARASWSAQSVAEQHADSRHSRCHQRDQIIRNVESIPPRCVCTRGTATEIEPNPTVNRRVRGFQESTQGSDYRPVHPSRIDNPSVDSVNAHADQLVDA